MNVGGRSCCDVDARWKCVVDVDVVGGWNEKAIVVVIVQCDDRNRIIVMMIRIIRRKDRGGDR